jgi:transposase
LEKDSRKAGRDGNKSLYSDTIGSGMPLLIRLAKVIERYKEGILNYYNFKVLRSLGRVEQQNKIFCQKSI